jgi:hypothetical protein
MPCCLYSVLEFGWSQRGLGLRWLYEARVKYHVVFVPYWSWDGVKGVMPERESGDEEEGKEGYEES